MQNDNNSNLLDLDSVFGNFSIQIFEYKHQILSNTSTVDFKIIHKNLSSTVKDILDTQKSVSFEKKVREVVYIMVSLADEIFLNLQWEGKKFWEENMLERHFFGTQIAGDRIFQNIDELISKDHIENLIIAEIYMKILSLGFKGKYRGLHDAEQEINIYRKRLFAFVEKHDKSIDMVEHRMFNQQYSRTLPTINRQFLPDTSIINYICAFFIFMFLVISSIVWILETRPLNEILQEISSMILRA